MILKRPWPTPGRCWQCPGRSFPGSVAVRYLSAYRILAVHNTVYNTVLLVLPFLCPTVTVTRFPRPPERDCPMTHHAISDDGNGAC
jgi:hypothetical protein